MAWVAEGLGNDSPERAQRPRPGLSAVLDGVSIHNHSIKPLYLGDPRPAPACQSDN